MKTQGKSIILLTILFFAVNCEDVIFLQDETKMQLNDYILYINGFINGTQLFKIAPNFVGCESSDTGLYTSIRDLSLYFNNHTWKSKGIALIVEDVSASFSYMFGNFSKIIHFCKVAPYDTIDLFKALKDYLSSPLKYITTFSKNILTHPYSFYKEYVRSKMLLEEGNPYLAGQNLGNLFKTIVFPSLNYNVELFVKGETNSLTELEDLFKCGINSYEISNKVINTVREYIRVFRKTGQKANIYEELMRIVGEDVPEIKSCLNTSVKILKILIRILLDN